MKRKKTILKVMAITILIGILISTVFAIYSISLFTDIENTIRFLGGAILVNLLAIVMAVEFKMWKKRNLKYFIIFFGISLLYISVVTFGSYKLTSIYSSVSNMTESNVRTYSSSVVVLKESSLQNLEDVKKVKIGYVDEEDNIEGTEIPNKIISEQGFDKKKVGNYDNYPDLLEDLLAGKIDAAFLPTRYNLMFNSMEEFEDIEKNTRIIYTEELERVEHIEEENQKSLDEPFTVLIMGVDAAGDNLPASFNGDALMLLTFNPNTLNTTVLSIPRDTYVPISCMGGRSNKITHAGWSGDKCFIQTIENFFEIKIDYYLKLNFSATVSIIDELGGVEVEIPYAFCEQDSKRRWGKNTVYVDAGLQHLNGEQALAFMRHRKVTANAKKTCGTKYTQNTGYWNDFVRGQSQQTVLKAVVNKMADEIKSFSTLEDLLAIVSNSSKTNMSTDTIFSLYNLGKDSLGKVKSEAEVFNMQRLYLSGFDAMIYDYSYIHNKGNKRVLYNYVPYDDSRQAVIDAMKVNLGQKNKKAVKTFSFSVKDEYVETVIGKGLTSKRSLERMPNLVGKTISYVETWANTNNMTLTIDYVEGKSGQQIGQIVGQNIPELLDMKYLPANRELVIKVVNSIPPIEPDPGDDSDKLDLDL